MTLVAPTLQAFFTDRLTRQLQASPRTIASYRDTLWLLLCFTQDTTGKQPAKLDWDDLTETLISAFLDHLETDRHNTPRTRNLRLTAIRSLFKYAALRHPEHASVIARVLSIPPKRHQKRQLSFLTTPAQAVLTGWLTERDGRPTDPLFVTRTGRRLSRDAIEQRVTVHATTATANCPSLQNKHLHPHALRHSCAMSLLQAGVDTTVIALWLGHADVEIGYIAFDPEAANLMFSLVSNRYERASMIITSNKPFSAWGEIFGDDMAATAMIDRLIHHSEILSLKGDSYRLRGKHLDPRPARPADLT